MVKKKDTLAHFKRGLAIILILVSLFILAVTIHESHNPNHEVEKTGSLELPNDIDKYFVNKEGCFIIYDFEANITYTYNEDKASKRISPCSTFKIYNSLFALDAGVINQDTIYEWDGSVHRIDHWNNDQTLSSAIKYSVVWFFQKIANNIGGVNMQKYIDLIEYGNQDISGGLTNFWLLSSLTVSPYEQIELLKKLYNNELPFSKDTLDTVKDILILEENEDIILSGKTGTGEDQLGWFIGVIENNQKRYAFVTNLEGLSGANGQSAKKITISILEQMNIL